MSYFKVELASQGEYETVEIEADSKAHAIKRVRAMMARYDKRWSSARVDRVREVRRDVESFGTENPLSRKQYLSPKADVMRDLIGIAILLAGAAAIVNYTMTKPATTTSTT